MKKKMVDRKTVNKDEMQSTYNRDAEVFKQTSEQLPTFTYIGGPEIDEFIQSIPDKSEAIICDQGCASGRIIKRIIANGIAPKNIVGVELSPDQAAIARSEISEATIIVGDLGTVDLKPDSVDAATQHMVAEHLDNETLEAVNKNTFRFLKPGGRYKVISTHPSKTAKTSELTSSGSFITTFPWGGEGENFHRTKEDLITAYQDAGFVIDSVKDLKLPEEAKKTHPEDYQRYKKYDFLRISIEMHKPEG